MKSAAKRDSYCELQDYLSSKSLNANCGFGNSRSHVRLRVEINSKQNNLIVLFEMALQQLWLACELKSFAYHVGLAIPS